VLQRLAIVILVCLTAVGVLGCGRSEAGENARRIAEAIAISSSETTLEATPEHLLGAWEREGDRDSGHPTMVTLHFITVSTGSAYSAIDDPDVPGVSAPQSFKYTVADGTVVLDYDSWPDETFVVDELRLGSMTTSVEGTATWAATAGWARAAR